MVFKITDKKNDIRKEKQSLIDIFYEASSKRYILGINEWADELIYYLEEKELSINGIIDDYTNQNFYKGIQVIKMNDIKDKDAIIVSCVIYGRLITAFRNLNSIGIYDVISYLDLCLFEEKLNNVHFCDNNIYDIENNKKKYSWLYEILADENSKQTLEHIIDFRYNFNIEAMKKFKYNLKYQYFDDLIKINDNEIFVDCGGFDGKTTEQFINLCPNYKAIYYFEPVEQYFEESINRLKTHGGIKFFNEGTYKESTKLRFFVNGSESSISENGESVIKVVKLDDAIKNEVTYIKMDLEGEEYNSLIGAERIIKSYKPKLAICVYHNQEDFWRIPELILSYNNSYKVYLRHYTEGLLETVMYFL